MFYIICYYDKSTLYCFHLDMDETKNTLRTDSTFCLKPDQNRFSRFKVNLDATYVKIREYSQRPLPMDFLSNENGPQMNNVFGLQRIRRETIFWKN